MIQRKQSLFLLFSIILMIGYLFSPVISLEGPTTPHLSIPAYNITKNIGFPVIGHYFVYVIEIAVGITVGINLLTIFLYKWRRVQMALCWVGIIPAVFCFCYIYYRWATTDIVDDQIFEYGNITPWVAVIFMLWAWISIRSDEELVRSVDRLR